MKKILSLLCILNFAFFISSAQDIIILKSGDELKTKVTEIGTSEIKYKKFENSDGPVYTVPKSDVFMIKYENGTKDVFTSSSTSQQAVKSSAASATSDKTFRALIYGGVSVPLGSFGDSEEGGAKIGFTAGHEGDVKIGPQSVYFTYNLNYTFHPYRFSFYDYGLPLDETKGSYGVMYLLGGFKFKSIPSPSRFYAFFNFGINIWTIGGDLKDVTLYYPSFYNSTTVNIKFKGSSTFAFSAGMGVELSDHFNLGIKYFNSKPKVKGTMSSYDSFNGNYFTSPVNGEQKIELLQMTFGYIF